MMRCAARNADALHNPVHSQREHRSEVIQLTAISVVGARKMTVRPLPWAGRASG
jgi:hypothetical protein